MGLRRKLVNWLFEDFVHSMKDELQALRDDIAALDSRVRKIGLKVEQQDEALKRLMLTLDKKADKAELYHLRDELEKIRGEIKEINEELYTFGERMDAVELLASEKSSGERLEETEIERLVLLFIKRGIVRPSDLREELGISWEKLYKALDNLIARRVIKRKQKGRKVEYVLAEEG